MTHCARSSTVCPSGHDRLTILIREAHELGDGIYAFKLGRRVCRMLVMIGDNLLSHGIAQPLHEFYEMAILPLGAHQGMRHTLMGIDLRELVGWVSHRMFHLKGVDPFHLTSMEYRIYQQKVLCGDYGSDDFHLLNPIQVPINPSLSPTNPLQRYCTAQNNLRLWALTGARNFSAERFPPENLYRMKGTSPSRGSGVKAARQRSAKMVMSKSSI